MTQPLTDWTELRDAWQGSPSAASPREAPSRESHARDGNALESRKRDLSARVQRATRRQRVVLASEIAITLGFGVFAWSAVRDADPNRIRIAVTTALIACTVWAFALWNQRGAWRPVGESTSEFVRLSYARLRAARRALYFVWLALALSVALYAPTFLARFTAHVIDEGEWWRWGFFAIYVALFLAWTYREQRRANDEEAFLDSVVRELAAE